MKKQQLIPFKKKKGEFTSFILMFLLVFAFMAVSLFLYKRNTSLILVKKAEESLKAATLAGATIDMDEYGTTGALVINDYAKSYADFKESLKNSMGLNDDFTSSDGIISGGVHVNRYTIYNVSGSTVECITYENDVGTPSIITGSVGSIKTPNNIPVTKSTIYGSVSFQIDGFVKNKSMMGKIFNMDDIFVTKDCCADITQY